MKAFPLVLMIGLLAAGCTGAPHIPTVTGSPGAADRPTTSVEPRRVLP